MSTEALDMILIMLSAAAAGGIASWIAVKLGDARPRKRTIEQPTYQWLEIKPQTKQEEEYWARVCDQLREATQQERKRNGKRLH